jgi:hypothetical protein
MTQRKGGTPRQLKKALEDVVADIFRRTRPSGPNLIEVDASAKTLLEEKYAHARLPWRSREWTHLKRRSALEIVRVHVGEQALLLGGPAKRSAGPLAGWSYPVLRM